jgi:hypothetical protein
VIPMPNVLAGILIGVVNDSWVTVLVSAAVWPLIFCLYVSIVDQQRRAATVAAFAERGRHLLFGSPLITFYAGEAFTGLLTALPFAVAAHLVKRLVT